MPFDAPVVDPPAHLLRIGALAVPSARANAVGTVRLTCGRDALAIDLLEVGRFAVGFAMLGMAKPVSFRVPFTAVRGLVRVGPLLHLALDERVASPYHRFALCRFSVDEHPSLLAAFRRRAGARLASWLLPLPLAALVAWQVPRSWVGGPVGIAALAAVVAFVAWRGLARVVDWLTRGGPDSDRIRDVFEATVAYRLGLAPSEEIARAAAPPPLAQPEAERIEAGQLGEAWATTTRPRIFLAVAALGLTAAVGAVLAVQRYGMVEEVLLPVDRARTGAAGPLQALFEGVFQRGMPSRAACGCERAVSPLWRDGLPLLGIVVAPAKGAIDELWITPGETVAIEHPGRPPDSDRAPEVELELAVVNNGAVTLDTVSLVVTFAQRTPQGRRTAIMERGLHWPAKLGPGESVRWSIEAEGTELRIDSRLTDRLGTVPAADAGAFVELLEARLMPVRVHAAMMLAYLGDSRARSVVEALGPLTTVEQQVRAEILRSLTPLRACGIELVEGRLELCVENGSGRLERRLLLSATTESGGAPRRWVVQDLFHPRRGLSVTMPWLLPAAPRVVEVDRLPPGAPMPEGAALLPRTDAGR